MDRKMVLLLPPPLLLLLLESAPPLLALQEEGDSSASGWRTALAAEYPQYLDLSPCGCDLTRGRCDTYCCCDKDCPASSSMSSMSCVAGLPGGRDAGGQFPELNCTDRSSPRYGREEHTILCLRDQHSSFLGLFHQNVPILTSSSSYDSAVDVAIAASDKYRAAGFVATEEADPAELREERAGEHQYRAGESIETVYDRESGLHGRLYLPSGSFHGSSGCVAAPVRFLRDAQSSCAVDIAVREDCSYDASPFLGRRAFLLATEDGLSHPLVRSNLSGSEGAPVDVRYRYADESEEDAVGGSEEGIDLSFDDDKGSCLNAVSSVEYVLFWDGPAIVKMSAQVVLLREVPLGQRIRQGFAVIHRHAKDESKEEEKRPGQPGYDRGRPLLSGHFEEDKEEEDAMVFTRDEGLRVWSPDPTSLCSGASTRRINFGEDSVSGCLVPLRRSDFADCAALFDAVAETSAALVSSSVVARGGDPDPKDEDDFVRVIHDQVESQVVNSTTEDVAVAAAFAAAETGDSHPLESLFPTCWVPSRTLVKIFYTRAILPDSESTPIFRLAGVMVSPQQRRWQWRCVVGGGGRKRRSGCGGDEETSDFPLEAAVRFEEIPLVWHHRNTSRFWVWQHSTRCEGDTCWKELMFPFTMGEEGWEVSRATMWALVLSGLAAMAMWMTRDYW